MFEPLAISLFVRRGGSERSEEGRTGPSVCDGVLPLLVTRLGMPVLHIPRRATADEYCDGFEGLSRRFELLSRTSRITEERLLNAYPPARSIYRVL